MREGEDRDEGKDGRETLLKRQRQTCRQIQTENDRDKTTGEGKGQRIEEWAMQSI